ncbi:MAG: DUF4421 family protein [Spirochaetes bacterium]|nr:DUF4421 family protein [Spirochaetota bacterium]
MKLSFLSIILLFLPVSSIYSAEDSTSESDKANHKPKNFVIKVMDNYSDKGFNISEEKDDLVYKSNAGESIDLSFSYKGFGLSTSIRRGYDYNTDKHGKSKIINCMLFSYKENTGVELYFNRNKGYYLDNEGSYDYVTGETETIRPDITRRQIGGNFYFSLPLSDNFSFANAYDFQNLIDKSGGALILYTGFNFIKLSSDSGLIPTEAMKYFNYSENLKSIDTINLYAGAGFMYTFSFYGLFIVPSLILSMGPSYSEYTTSGNQTNSTNNESVFNFDIKFTFGYNRESFAIGFYIIGNTSYYGMNNCHIYLDNTKLGCFAGVRF